MPSLGGSGRYGGDDVSGGSSRGGYARDRDRSGTSEIERQNKAARLREAAQQATQAPAQTGGPQYGQRGYMRSIGEYAGPEGRGYGDPATGRPTQDISMRDEIKQRGRFKALASHLMGAIPGMDVQGREFVAQPGKPAGPAPSITTGSLPRFVGDMLTLGTGIPMLGDLAQEGYEAMGGGQPSDISTAMASLLDPGASRGAMGGQGRDRDNRDGGGFLPMPQVAAAPIAPTPEQTEEERLALAAALMGGPGYTRAGQGIVNV